MLPLLMLSRHDLDGLDSFFLFQIKLDETVMHTEVGEHSYRLHSFTSLQAKNTYFKTCVCKMQF